MNVRQYAQQHKVPVSLLFQEAYKKHSPRSNDMGLVAMHVKDYEKYGAVPHYVVAHIQKTPRYIRGGVPYYAQIA